MRHPVEPLATDPLLAGRDALRRYAWREGFELLSTADARTPLAADDLEALAEAAWWSGQRAAVIDARERAYRLYLDTGQVRRAGYAAVLLATSSAIQTGGTYKGKGVHEAARIGALADGGEIVFSGQTLEGLVSRVPVANPQTVTLKGISAPIRVYSVQWQ